MGMGQRKNKDDASGVYKALNNCCRPCSQATKERLRQEERKSLMVQEVRARMPVPVMAVLASCPSPRALSSLPPTLHPSSPVLSNLPLRLRSFGRGSAAAKSRPRPARRQSPHRQTKPRAPAARWARLGDLPSLDAGASRRSCAAGTCFSVAHAVRCAPPA